MREVREELNCGVEPSSVAFIGEFVTAAANEPDTRLVARVYQGQLVGVPVASNEIEELRWLADDGTAQELMLAPLLEDWVLPQLREMGLMGHG